MQGTLHTLTQELTLLTTLYHKIVCVHHDWQQAANIQYNSFPSDYSITYNIQYSYTYTTLYYITCNSDVRLVSKYDYMSVEMVN